MDRCQRAPACGIVTYVSAGPAAGGRVNCTLVSAPPAACALAPDPDATVLFYPRGEWTALAAAPAAAAGGGASPGGTVTVPGGVSGTVITDANPGDVAALPGLQNPAGPVDGKGTLRYGCGPRPGPRRYDSLGVPSRGVPNLGIR
jgi:hypothetical protein